MVVIAVRHSWLWLDENRSLNRDSEGTPIYHDGVVPSIRRDPQVPLPHFYDNRRSVATELSWSVEFD